MNKTELIAAVAEKADLSKKDAEAAITATVDAITEALTQGEKVQLVGFGSFEVKKRAARVGRNPKTGEETVLHADEEDGFFGLFGFTGKKTTGMFDGVLDMEGGYIKTDECMRTNVPGVFAAGDCTGQPLQVSKAVGEGQVAGHRAAEYVDTLIQTG